MWCTLVETPSFIFIYHLIPLSKFHCLQENKEKNYVANVLGVNFLQCHNTSPMKKIRNIFGGQNNPFISQSLGPIGI